MYKRQVLLVSAAIGIAISRLPRDSRSQEVLLAFFTGAQEVLFILVKWLIRVLPIGIFGFISALVVEMNKGVEIGGLGTYFGVILAANFVQMLVCLLYTSPSPRDRLLSRMPPSA